MTHLSLKYNILLSILATISFVVLNVGLSKALQPTATPTPPFFYRGEPLFIEAENPYVMREGDWQMESDPQAHGGYYLISNTPNDALTFEFVGPTLDVVYFEAPQGGVFVVEIDGMTRQTVHTTGNTRQVGVNVSNLEDKPHVARVYVLHHTVKLDAFYARVSPEVAQQIMLVSSPIIQTATPTDAVTQGPTTHLPTSVGNITPTPVIVYNESQLQTAIAQGAANPNEPVVIYLGGDITLSEPITVDGNVVINGNNNTISGQGNGGIVINATGGFIRGVAMRLLGRHE